MQLRSQPPKILFSSLTSEYLHVHVKTVKVYNHTFWQIARLKNSIFPGKLVSLEDFRIAFI